MVVIMKKSQQKSIFNELLCRRFLQTCPFLVTLIYYIIVIHSFKYHPAGTLYVNKDAVAVLYEYQIIFELLNALAKLLAQIIVLPAQEINKVYGQHRACMNLCLKFGCLLTLMKTIGIWICTCL